MQDFNLALILNLRDNISQGAQRLSGQLETLQGRLDAARQGFDNLRRASQGVALAGAAITAPLAGMARAAMGYEHALGQIATLTDHSLQEIKDRYGEGLLAIAEETGQSSANMAQAMYDALSAGISEDEVMEFLRVSGRAAVAGATDISVATDGLTTAMNAWSEFGYNAAQTSDIMFTAVNAGKTTLEEIAGSVGNVASMSAAAGVSMEETMAAMATLTAGGQSTSQAFTGVRAVMQAVMNPSQQASDTFRRLGIEVNAATLAQDGLQGTITSVSQAINEYTDDAALQSEMLGQVFGRVEGLTSVMALGGAQAGRFNEILSDMGGAAGATDDAFEKMAESVKFQWDQMMTSLRNTAIVLGDMLLPAVSNIISRVQVFVGWMRDWIDNNRALATGIMTGVLAIGGFMTVVGTAGIVVGTLGSGVMSLAKNISGIGKLFLKAIPMIAGWAKSMFLAAAAHWAVIWPILAIIAAIAAVILVIRNFDNIISWISDRFQAFAQFARDAFAPIRNAFQSLVDWLSSFSLFDAGANILRTLAEGIVSLAFAPINAVRNVVGRIRDFLPFSPAREGPLTDIDESGGALMRTVAQGIDGAPVADGMADALSGLVLGGAGGGATAGAGGGGGSFVINLEQVFHLSGDEEDARRVGSIARDGVVEAIERHRQYQERVSW